MNILGEISLKLEIQSLSNHILLILLNAVVSRSEEEEKNIGQIENQSFGNIWHLHARGTE